VTGYLPWGSPFLAQRNGMDKYFSPVPGPSMNRQFLCRNRPSRMMETQRGPVSVGPGAFGEPPDPGPLS